MNANFLKAIICLSTLLSLIACSNDDELLLEPKAQSRDVISFNVTSDRLTRTTLFNSSEDITKFMVSALIRTPGNSNYKEYFSKDYVEKVKGLWKNFNGERYWPNNGESLDFYAWTTSSNEMNSNNYNKIWMTSYGIFRFSNNSPDLYGIYQQSYVNMHDLCYATSLSCDKKNSTPAVTLKFKHAFAKIDINAKVINPSLKVDILGITLVNLTKGGDLFFPKDSNEKCTWQIYSDEPLKIGISLGVNEKNPISISMIKQENGDRFISQEVNLTTNVTTGEPNPFMIIPFDHYIPITPSAVRDASNSILTKNETAIRLTCKVWNIADIEKGYQSSDISLLEPNGSSGNFSYIYIPVALNAEPGKKYTYTITFGQGNAGFDTNGNPSIVKVDWNVDSKEWTEGLPEPQTIPM